MVHYEKLRRSRYTRLFDFEHYPNFPKILYIDRPAKGVMTNVRAAKGF
jgi:hypothetical protein